MYIFVYACIYAYVSIYMRMHVYVYAYIYMRMYVCMCVYTFICAGIIDGYFRLFKTFLVLSESLCCFVNIEEVINKILRVLMNWHHIVLQSGCFMRRRSCSNNNYGVIAAQLLNIISVISILSITLEWTLLICSASKHSLKTPFLSFVLPPSLRVSSTLFHILHLFSPLSSCLYLSYSLSLVSRSFIPLSFSTSSSYLISSFLPPYLTIFPYFSTSLLFFSFSMLIYYT